MTTDTGDWEPIEADQLQIGQYIRINHRWFDHPFVRRSFQISSEREIATIREVQLTRMFVDRNRPAPVSTAAAGPAASVADIEGDAAAGAAAEVDTAAQVEQLAMTARIKVQRISLDSARARVRVTHERAQTLLGALNSVDATSATLVDDFVDYLVAILNNSTTPLALMASAAPKHSSKRYLLQTSDAVSLVALIGKRMGLKAAQLRTLTQAAATHILGLARMPPQLVDEEPNGGQLESATSANIRCSARRYCSNAAASRPRCCALSGSIGNDRMAAGFHASGGRRHTPARVDSRAPCGFSRPAATTIPRR